jgi:hypothetical protein
MMLLFALMIAAGIAGLLFAGSAMLILRRDRRRFLKAVEEGRFEVARVDRGQGERFRTVEIAGLAGGQHFVLLSVIDPARERVTYRLTLGGSYPYRRRCRSGDALEPLARARYRLLRHVRSRLEGSPRQTAA